MPSLLHENHYVFGIIEGKTRFFIQYYIKENSAVFTRLKDWYEEYIVLLRLTSEDKETIRHIFLNTDMRECTSHNTKQFLRSVGIELTTTSPYTPEHNIIIERVWRTIGKSTGNKRGVQPVISIISHLGFIKKYLCYHQTNNIMVQHHMCYILRYLDLSVMLLY